MLRFLLLLRRFSPSSVLYIDTESDCYIKMYRQEWISFVMDEWQNGVQNYGLKIGYILAFFCDQLPLATITVCHRYDCICKSSVLPGIEVQAAWCCCVNAGVINLDIKEETAGTAAVSIKILPCSGAWCISYIEETEQRTKQLLPLLLSLRPQHRAWNWKPLGWRLSVLGDVVETLASYLGDTAEGPSA